MGRRRRAVERGRLGGPERYLWRLVLLSQPTSAGSSEPQIRSHFGVGFYIFRASAGGRLCTATRLSATVSKLHRHDYVGCFALAGIGDRFGWRCHRRGELALLNAPNSGLTASQQAAVHASKAPQDSTPHVHPASCPSPTPSIKIKTGCALLSPRGPPSRPRTPKFPQSTVMAPRRLMQCDMDNDNFLRQRG